MSKDRENFSPKRSGKIKPLKIDIINKGYIPLLDNSYNMFTGEGGVGKSQLAIKSMVIYLLDNPLKQALMFMSEDGINECMSRLKSVCQDMRKNHEEIDKRIFWITLEESPVEKLVFKQNGEKLKNDVFIDELITFVIGRGIGFVCLDPLRAFHDLEENSNDEMPFLTREFLPVFAAVTKSCVLVLHHSAKGAGSQVRGASSIANDSRLVWNVSKVVKKDNMTGKIEQVEAYANKIKLSVYKDNFAAARFCSIRDNEGMIELPVIAPSYKIEVEEIRYDMPKY